MLIIKRKAQDIITIAPLEGIDTSLPISEIFNGGVIEIKLLEVGRRQVKVAIDAPPQLQIWRGRKEPQSSEDNNATEDVACG
jgi:sRNA-binding carbon storage regulator CsrA